MGSMGQPMGGGGGGQMNNGFGAQMGGQMGSGIVSDVMSNPLTNQLGNVAVTQVKGIVSQYLPFVDSLWNALRIYFAVNNQYVKKKLLAMLLPFRKTDWARRTGDDHDRGHGGAAPPFQDENAPDLYIPLMAFTTYVLLTGLVMGTAGEFTPEVIYDVGTTCVVYQVIQICAIKLGLFLMDTSLPTFDLVAFTGYEYVPLCINMLFGILLGSWAYYLSLLYTASALTFFTLQTLQQAVPRSGTSQGSQRRFMLLGFSCLQFLMVWWLGYSSYL